MTPLSGVWIKGPEMPEDPTGIVEEKFTAPVVVRDPRQPDIFILFSQPEGLYCFKMIFKVIYFEENH